MQHNIFPIILFIIACMHGHELGRVNGRDLELFRVTHYSSCSMQLIIQIPLVPASEKESSSVAGGGFPPTDRQSPFIIYDICNTQSK